MALPTPEEQDEMFAQMVADDERIKQFILTNKGKNVEVEIKGLTLLIPPVIPKKLRHELARIQRKGEVSIEEAEKDTYYLLSLLCQNEPWNRPEAWEYVDDQTGIAMDLLAELLESAYTEEKKTKSFRRK